ncbi:MAG: glycosyltransferase family 1 protein [Candidatus Saccharibacteria bacterium]
MKQKIYIDALALVPERKSGIGYSLEQTLLQLREIPAIRKGYAIQLVVPLGKARYIRKYVSSGVSVRTIFLPARGMELLLRLGLFPPVDWLLGRGIYVFPNYRNWPLWASQSLTYIYDLGYLLYPETVQQKNLRYLRRYAKRWIGRANRIITITNQVREEIEKNLDLHYGSIDVVYCGVDAKVFYRRPAREVDAVLQKYAVPFKDYVLFVGNIEPRKNITGLLDAYDRLPKHIREQCGIVVVGGDGWSNEDVLERMRQAEAAGQKIYRVPQYVTTEDLPALYSGAKALVHPAMYEGFGITPLEAMACETPVIVSDIPAIREVVQGDAIYIDPKDPQSLADAITKLYTADAGLVNARSVQHRVRELSWKRSAEELAAVIEAASDEQAKGGFHIKRAKRAYVRLDRLIRSMLGQKKRPPYKPQTSPTDKQAFRRMVYEDFLQEQPSHLQAVLLGAYRSAKTGVSRAIGRRQ